MEKFLSKIFTPLKKIEPNSSYLSQSKKTILLSEQEPTQESIKSILRPRFLEGISLRTSFALASLLLIIITGSVSYLKSSSTPLAGSLNDEALAQEINSIDFQVQVKEVSYFNQSARDVSLALDEISSPSQNQ